MLRQQNNNCANKNQNSRRCMLFRTDIVFMHGHDVTSRLITATSNYTVHEVRKVAFGIVGLKKTCLCEADIPGVSTLHKIAQLRNNVTLTFRSSTNDLNLVSLFHLVCSLWLPYVTDILKSNFTHLAFSGTNTNNSITRHFWRSIPPENDFNVSFWA